MRCSRRLWARMTTVSTVPTPQSGADRPQRHVGQACCLPSTCDRGSGRRVKVAYGGLTEAGRSLRSGGVTCRKSGLSDRCCRRKSSITTKADAPSQGRSGDGAVPKRVAATGKQPPLAKANSTSSFRRFGGADRRCMNQLDDLRTPDCRAGNAWIASACKDRLPNDSSGDAEAAPGLAHLFPAYRLLDEPTRFLVNRDGLHPTERVSAELPRDDASQAATHERDPHEGS